MALVSCQNLNLSSNDIVLKKSYSKVDVYCTAKMVSFQHFWEFRKNAPLWKAVVCRPLNIQKTKGYQWKDNIHIFHLIRSGTLCVTTGLVTGNLTKTGRLWYKIFVLPRVDLFPCGKASLAGVIPMKGIYQNVGTLDLGFRADCSEHGNYVPRWSPWPQGTLFGLSGLSTRFGLTS